MFVAGKRPPPALRGARAYHLTRSLIDTTYGLALRFEALAELLMIHGKNESQRHRDDGGHLDMALSRSATGCFAGKTEAKLDLLAIRRVQLRIDRELNEARAGIRPGGRRDAD